MYDAFNSLYFRLLGIVKSIYANALWHVESLRVPLPRVTIFGGARFGQQDPFALEAHKLAQLFINANISVITGGGPGIMGKAEIARCRHWEVKHAA